LKRGDQNSKSLQTVIGRDFELLGLI